MRTDPDNASGNLLPEGEYEAFVENAIEGESKKGNGMITLTWRVQTPDGKARMLKDYLVEGIDWRTKKLCKAINRLDAFESRNVRPEVFLDQRALLYIKIEESDNAEYDDQNRVGGYKPSKFGGKPVAKSERAPEPVGSVNEQGINEDDIPF